MLKCFDKLQHSTFSHLLIKTNVSFKPHCLLALPKHVFLIFPPNVFTLVICIIVLFYHVIKPPNLKHWKCWSNAFLSGRKLHFLISRESVLRDVHRCLEAIWLMHGQLSQHFPVQSDVPLHQTMHKILIIKWASKFKHACLSMHKFTCMLPTYHT